MKLKNRITAGLCMALAMVSLLHPFSGEMVYAETAAEAHEAEEAETAAEAHEAEETETAAEAREVAEAETETETHTHTSDETETATEDVDVHEPEDAETVTEETGAAEEAETAAEETQEVEDAETVTEEAAETETEEAERIRMSFYMVNEDEEEILLEETDIDAGIMLADAGDGAIATDSGSVEVGQINTYSCTKSVQTWTVPASGKYRITCRGGHGGSMNNYDYNGGAGSVRAGTMKLKKGEVLYIYVGGNGESGGRHSHGSAKGNTGGYNGGADSDYDEGSLGRKGRYWTHGSGGGASDVRIGGTGLDNQIIVAGGGGGANKETGGKAADTGHYNGRRLNGSGESGGGGYYGGQGHYGGSSYINTAYFEDITEQNGVSGSGAVIISVEQLYPDIALKADADWTSEDIVITAVVEEVGKGLPEYYLSWETDDEGNDIWTDETNYTVSQNGTYTCKIRDVEGNIEETSIEITNIDRLQPEGELTADITDWTREDVTLTITADDAEATEAYAKSGLAEPPYLWGYRDENGNVIWESKEVGEAEETPETEDNWTDETTHIASQNGTYLCRVRDKAGNESTYEYTVSNIDRTAPEVDYEHPDKWYEGGTTLTWKAADLQPDGSAGCGLHETPYSYNGTDWTTNTIQEIQAAGTYRIWVRDKLENVAECTFWVGYDKRPSGKKGIDILEPELFPDLDADMQPEEILELLTASAASVKGDQGTEKILQRKDESDMRNTDELFAPVFMAEEEIPEALPLLEINGDGDLSDAAMQSLLLGAEDEQGRQIPWKKIVLYSVWMVTVLCGLLWILFCLLFEHVEVYQKNKQGRYERIGRCALIRKREYTQVNLSGFMKKQREQDYMLRFSHLYVRFHKREKVLIRTLSGIELRNVARKIEVLC